MSQAPVGTAQNPIARLAARVLPVDPCGRLLLLHGYDPADPAVRYWFTVGGGLAAGERPVDAAVRELYEETGLAVDAAALGEPVWRQVTDFPFDGLWYRQEQDFFVLRGDPWRVHLGGLAPHEQRSIDGYRWWQIDELVACGEAFYPLELAGPLRDILNR